jgi:signal transduction histidine kinase
MRRRRDRRGRELEARRRQALEIHDNLVQGLTAIHWALEAGAYEQARELTAAALAQTQAMIGDLLGDDHDGHTFAPGALRRERAA